MFNLLPQEEQSVLVKEGRLRFAVAALFFLGAIGIIALVALFPSYFLSNQKEIATEKREETLKKQIESSPDDDLSKILKLTEEKVAALGQGASEPYVYELAADIIRNKTSDIKITGMSFDRTAEGKRNITVMGQALNRDTLKTFEQALGRVKVFSAVDVPPSNFADAEDIRFSILVKVQ